MYLGGKARQAKHLAPFILACNPEVYVEPFLGGASVAVQVVPYVPLAYLSDAHPDLILMWQAAASGWVPPTEVSEERWCELRASPPSPERAHAGFGCSFGGKFFGGYARSSRGEPYALEASRSIVRKASALRGASIERQDYRDSIRHAGPGAVFYLDPPYAGTTGYSTVAFDHGEFWRWAQEVSDLGATVLVSEFTAPDWADVVYERWRAASVRRTATGEKQVMERLYQVRSPR